MNRIILIGNGFDLAHGLPTRYVDFIDWYWNECVLELRKCYQRFWSDELCSLTLKISATWDCWMPRYAETLKGKDIIQNLQKENNYININFSPLFENISKCIDKQGWVDIENEYYKLLQSLQTDKKYENPKKLNDELDFLKFKLAEYLKSIQDNTKNSINNS